MSHSLVPGFTFSNAPRAVERPAPARLPERAAAPAVERSGEARERPRFDLPATAAERPHPGQARSHAAKTDRVRDQRAETSRDSGPRDSVRRDNTRTSPAEPSAEPRQARSSGPAEKSPETSLETSHGTVDGAAAEADASAGEARPEQANGPLEEAAPATASPGMPVTGPLPLVIPAALPQSGDAGSTAGTSTEGNSETAPAVPVAASPAGVAATNGPAVSPFGAVALASPGAAGAAAGADGAAQPGAGADEAAPQSETEETLKHAAEGGGDAQNKAGAPGEPASSPEAAKSMPAGLKAALDALQPATGPSPLPAPAGAQAGGSPQAAGGSPQTAGAMADPAQRIVENVPFGAVAVEIGMKSLAGVNRFQIRLDPPELGRIDVRLDISDDGEVTARLSVDRVETLAMLQRDAKTLERAFEQAGLKPSDGGVDLSLRDPGGQGQGQNFMGQNAGQDGRRGHEPGGRPLRDGRPEPEAIAAPIVRHRVWGSASGVDVRI